MTSNKMTTVSTTFPRAPWWILLLLAATAPVYAAISIVQATSNAPFTNISSISAAYASAQAAGDLNVVVISWEDSTGSVQSITDTSGNTYHLAVGPTTQSGLASQSIYYAQNIRSAAANANTVTITFAAAVPHPDLRILEYSGIDPANAFDVGTGSGSTTGTTADSGSVTTTSANEVLIGADVIAHSFASVGPGYTLEVRTAHDDVAEDQIVSAAGAYHATVTQSSSGWWVMQIAAFRAAGGAPAAPYPQSAILGSISWNYAGKQRYGEAGRSDIWDSTWYDDGSPGGVIYAGWGDGFGFSATQKAELGISTLSGTPDSPPLTGADIFHGAPNPPECPGTNSSLVGGKPEGIVALPGVLYLHHSTGDCTISWLAKSTDGGHTWSDHIPASAPLQWPDANGFSPVGFLQYGISLAGTLIPESTGIPYIYVYLGNGTKVNGVSVNANKMYLARVPASPTSSIESLSNWQFYGAPATNGDPNWVSSSANAVPVWTDPNNSESIVVTFDKAIGRYIAYNDHGLKLEREVGLFDAPSPWGPWTTFDYEEQFDNTSNASCTLGCVGNGGAVSFQFMQKWISADGLSLWAEYSSDSTFGSISYDALQMIKGTVTLASGSTIKGLSLSTGKPAVLDRMSTSNSGNLEYIDRNYRWTNIGTYNGKNLEVVRLPNNDKGNADNPYVSFTMTTGQNVCVAWDPANTPPSWLSSAQGWTLTANRLTGNTTFDVYMKHFSAGLVQLQGPGSGARDNYILFVGCQ